MNKELMGSKLSPESVVIIYSSNNGRDYYLEQRSVQSVGGKNVLMAPVPMPEETIKNIARKYVASSSSKIHHATLIPEFILHGFSDIGKTVVIWYRPAMVRKLNFDSALRIKGEKMVKVPATLYAIINRELFVFALDNDSRPDAKTKLYNAPFFNIYVDGNVCLGSARLGNKQSTFEAEAERFERAFYMAEQNGGDRTTTCKTPLKKLWATLIGSKAMFPKKELIQHRHKTLGQFMENKIKRNRTYED